MLQQRRQRKRQKAIDWPGKTTPSKFARPTHFFTYFFAVTTTIKLPKFTFYGGGVRLQSK